MWVYIINFENGKKYVGVSNQPEARMYQHEHGHFPVGRAMRKHKWRWELVFEGSDEECFAKEVELISSLGTLSPGGYNLTFGGEGALTSPEVTKRRGEAVRKAFTPEKRKRHSKILREAHTRPGMQEAASKRTADYWSRPENQTRKKELSELMKRLAKDPERTAKRLEGCRLARERKRLERERQI